MSRSAISIKAFGFYAMALGAGLVLVPNLLLTLFGMPQTQEVWIRALGVLAFNIGIYYWAAAEAEAIAVFRVTVWTRLLVLACFVAFVLLGLAKPVLILFGVVEALGALWTWLALRSEKREGQRAYPASRIDPRYESRM